MPRPFFLRRPSSRIARQISGEEREPISGARGDVFAGALILLCCVGVGSAVLILVLGAPLLNLVCWGVR
ncbi:hypothetical protein SAMN05216466_107135 [Paraburkholderia phenazinium]|uniref:Uncharacterized protein n=1 Tax=Paraburkholderia phenazinium TaxID=60549 RepID=A0A1G7ZQQ2_9BURK|nr:hypothetical protein SAMN05216466_107135 [Paraburkholderia phenazinium]